MIPKHIKISLTRKASYKIDSPVLDQITEDVSQWHLAKQCPPRNVFLYDFIEITNTALEVSQWHLAEKMFNPFLDFGKLH